MNCDGAVFVSVEDDCTPPFSSQPGWTVYGCPPSPAPSLVVEICNCRCHIHRNNLFLKTQTNAHHRKSHVYLAFMATPTPIAIVAVSKDNKSEDRLGAGSERYYLNGSIEVLGNTLPPPPAPCESRHMMYIKLWSTPTKKGARDYCARTTGLLAESI